MSDATRSRFQLRLSSVITLMFIAALLVFANSVPRLSGEIIRTGFGNRQDRGYGWPIVFHVVEVVELTSGASRPASTDVGLQIYFAVMDLAIASVILIVSAVLLGRTPRWRKARPQ